MQARELLETHAQQAVVERILDGVERNRLAVLVDHHAAMTVVADQEDEGGAVLEALHQLLVGAAVAGQHLKFPCGPQLLPPPSLNPLIG